MSDMVSIVGPVGEPTVTRVHVCKRCGARESVFWHPFSYGCGLSSAGHADGGQYFELCDRCHEKLVGWMSFDACAPSIPLDAGSVVGPWHVLDVHDARFGGWMVEVARGPQRYRVPVPATDAERWRTLVQIQADALAAEPVVVKKTEGNE